MTAALAVLALPFLALAGLFAYRARFMRWYERETNGAAYFGRTRAGRDAFKRELQERSRGMAAIARPCGVICPLSSSAPSFASRSRASRA